MTRPVVFWDIDGTLLTTARAGIFAWEDALRELTGLSRSLQDFPTAGLTDVEIGRRILDDAGAESSSDLVGPLLRRYEALLPTRLSLRHGRVLPGVRDVLDALRDRQVPSLLLTGNTQTAARIKLAHYGLADYFSEGGFAEDGEDRAAIARHAATVARHRFGGIPAERMYVIGDTPQDISCGRAIGARTIAVATGPYALADLRTCAPWSAVPQLPPPEMFIRLIEDGLT